MAQSVLFEYEIRNFNDVRDHLDALWLEFNQLVAALGSIPPVCGDPPDTCGFSFQAQKSADKGAKKGAGKGVKQGAGTVKRAKRAAKR